MAYEGRLRACLRNIWVVFRNTFRARSKQLPLDAAGVMEVRFAPALLVGTLVCITTAVF